MSHLGVNQKQVRNKNINCMTKQFFIVFLLIVLICVSCKESPSKEKPIHQKAYIENTKTQSVEGLRIYQSKNLIITKLSNHIYQHISFLNTDDFGKVECNGMVVINENEGIVFDTPTDNDSSMELINFISKELKATLIAVIPTHFHEDCVGGIQEFEKLNIPIYVSKRTAALLKENGQNVSNAMTTFDSSLTLNIGNKEVYAEYFGEGHTKDNVIGIFPESNAVFGGCLIKTFGAGKGYLGDAITDKWSETVKKIKSKYPNAEIVIPGHGKLGGTELFDYTIKLFELK